MSITCKTIDYYDENVLLEGYLAYSNTGPSEKPAILIVHMWGGRVEFVCEKARQLAKLGYTAFAVDMYGKGVIGSSPEENSQLMQPFMEDRSLILKRLDCAIKKLCTFEQVDKSAIAAIGYCFGGLCVLDLARSGLSIKGIVSIHGLLNPPPNDSDSQTSEHINSKVLVLHGSNDPLADMQQVWQLQQELSNANADWQLHIYGAAQHAFTNPQAQDKAGGMIYNHSADKRAWQDMLQFFDNIFS